MKLTIDHPVTITRVGKTFRGHCKWCKSTWTANKRHLGAHTQTCPWPPLEQILGKVKVENRG